MACQTIPFEQKKTREWLINWNFKEFFLHEIQNCLENTVYICIEKFILQTINSLFLCRLIESIIAHRN